MTLNFTPRFLSSFFLALDFEARISIGSPGKLNDGLSTAVTLFLVLGVQSGRLAGHETC